MSARYNVILILMVVAISGPLTAGKTDALSCSVPSFTEAFERHDLLLHGTLTNKEFESAQPLDRNTAELTFDTIKVYKGEYRETFTIKADLSWDDYYREGGEYVLFADKDDNEYVRELCVGDYVASPSIIEFLDGYPLNVVVGTGVNSLYDLVTGFERDNLDILMARYSTLNRGDDALRNLAQRGGDFSYTCDFPIDLQESPKYLANVPIVRDFNENNPNSTVTFQYDLESSPPVAVVNFEGEDELAHVFVMYARDIGNCFAVYISKLVDRGTGEVLREHNNLNTICGAENSHAIFPDLCPYTESPKMPTVRSGFGLMNTLYVVIAVTVAGAFSYVIYRKKRK